MLKYQNRFPNSAQVSSFFHVVSEYTLIWETIPPREFHPICAFASSTRLSRWDTFSQVPAIYRHRKVHTALQGIQDKIPFLRCLLFIDIKKCTLRVQSCKILYLHWDGGNAYWRRESRLQRKWVEQPNSQLGHYAKCINASQGEKLLVPAVLWNPPRCNQWPL